MHSLLLVKTGASQLITGNLWPTTTTNGGNNVSSTWADSLTPSELITFSVGSESGKSLVIASRVTEDWVDSIQPCQSDGNGLNKRVSGTDKD